MWRLKAPAREERRNSASVVELRRAQQLAQIRIEGEKSPSLRRANSCKEKDPILQPSDSFLKIPQAHHFGSTKDIKKLLSKRRSSSSDTRAHKSRFSPKGGSPRISPRGSPKASRSHEGKGHSSLNFILGNNSKSSKDSKDGRSVKDLRYGEQTNNEDFQSEGRRSRRSSSGVPSLTNIPEHYKTTENSSLVIDANNCKLPSYKSCDYFFKIMLLGDTGVGKTCFVTKFRDNIFLSGTFIATVGIDYRTKMISMGGKKVQLQVWDTTGQERFRNLSRSHYKDVHGIILLYDIHHRPSFSTIRSWLIDIRQISRSDVVILLVGNKSDMPETTRCVSREEGEAIAREADIPFMEASAKSGNNVELAFTAMARQLKANHSSEGRFSLSEYIDSKEKKAIADICGQCRLC